MSGSRPSRRIICLTVADVMLEPAGFLALFVVEHCAHILKNFASTCFCVAALRAGVASVLQFSVASDGGLDQASESGDGLLRLRETSPVPLPHWSNHAAIQAVFITGLIYALIGVVIAGGGIWLAVLGGSPCTLSSVLAFSPRLHCAAGAAPFRALAVCDRAGRHAGVGRL